jgi:acyl transferase domain-containing protein/SAM-dependent methyltransferase/acyl carrier protein
VTDVPATEALSPVKRALVEIRDLKARLADAQRRLDEPIAVVGMGLRLPGGAVDADSYWRLLIDGVDAITEVPAQRWSAHDLLDDDPDAAGRMITRWGGFLDGVDRFDHEFFGISPREAESMDPQQRLLLEVAWEALEDANIPADGLFGTDVGVFVGIANSDYMRMLLADRAAIDTYTTTGNALSIAAGRLAYVLGVHGPAMSVDTACSSSLVAVHLAMQSLRRGECALALAGGVNLILSPELTINFSRARMMAADGRCKTFDAAADGYVRSEGCAMVALKRLGDAVAAGDQVLAVLRGSAVNQDGRSGGLTAPSGPAQERVLAAALDAAGARAGDIGYVEAHGTGTLLGDPIEVGALGAVLCRDRDSVAPLLLGSVKTNIGHTESAAGVAGLIKVVLMLQHGVVPPHLHLHELNPHIAGRCLPIAVPSTLTPWPRPAGAARLAGVSSFGLSGTNAHVIVAEAPAPAAAVDAAAIDGRDRPATVVLSARHDESLTALAEACAELLDDPAADLAAVARTTQLGRARLARRAAVTARRSADASERLRAFARGDLADEQPDERGASFVDQRVAGGSPAGGVAFVFTGHGSHHPRAGASLMAAEPAFAAAIDRCAAVLDRRLAVPLRTVLFGTDGELGEARRDDMAIAQPALFSLQYALTELWASWGVRPTYVAGHSAGEYVAAVLAGVLSLDDALELIATRGQLMASLPDDGEMVALFVDEATVAPVVARHGDDVGIAAVNGPSTTVISGRRAAVDAVISELGLEQGELRRLDVSVAAHSPLVEPILDGLTSAVRAVHLQRPSIGLVSSMTGTPVDSEITDADYWRRHLRQPVRFAAVFDGLRAAGCTTFVEIGPHPTLLGLGRRAWPDDRATWVPSMRRDAHEQAVLAHGCALLFAGGVDVDWVAVDGGRRGPLVDLPRYPWRRSSHWSPLARTDHRSAAPRWPSAVAAARTQAEQGPLDLELDRCAPRFATLTDIAVDAIVNAFAELGLFRTAGERHDLSSVLHAGRFKGGSEHLAMRWLDDLVDRGLLRRDGDDFVAPSALAAVDVEARLDAARPGFAGVEPLLDYVGRCALRLAAVVTGEESPLALLFPDGDQTTVDFLYGGWAVPRYFNGIVRAAVAAVAGARPGERLRVLEIGAGTGGTTAAVLPALPPDRTTYAFTDVSELFLHRAAERFAAFPFVRCALLDIEQAPEEQGVQPGSYDVVVAANVLHATRDLDATLAHVHAVLAPGGVLVAYEGTAHPAWFDVSTGLIEGWQRFADGWRTDVPLLRPDVWDAALRAAGFSDVAVLPGPDAPTAALLHHVLVARAGGAEAGARPVAEPEATTIAVVVVPGEDVDIRAALDAALPDERIDVLVDAVRAAVAGVLRVDEPHRLPRDQPLLDLGFDSLMAVELRNVLRQRLGLPGRLPATIVFDHPTIGALAEYVGGLLGNSTATPADDTVAHVDGPGSPAVLDDADVAELSDDEVEALLLERLTELDQ